MKMNVLLINGSKNSIRDVINCHMDKSNINNIIVVNNETSDSELSIINEKLKDSMYVVVANGVDDVLLCRCFIYLDIDFSSMITIGDANSVKNNPFEALLVMNDYNKRCAIYDSFIKQHNQYFSCDVDEDVHFIGSTTDNVIMKHQYATNNVWSKESLDLFYKLSHEYYDLSNTTKRYFVDIGANIGTSCIYFKKKLDEAVKLIAFEPQPTTFKMLKINTILNDLDNDSFIINAAVGENNSFLSMHYVEDNPGASYVTDSDECVTIPSTRFDTFLTENHINPDEIKYMWIDTEGFEYSVLKGCIDVLKDQNIPVFMEFTPWMLEKRYGVNICDFVDLISTAYSKYAISEDSFLSVHDIATLKVYADNYRQFDIFLIK